MKRAVVLLPPSKGKTDNDDASGPSYRDTLGQPHPLNRYRTEVLDAIAAEHRQLDAKAQLRLYGVNEEKRAATATLTDDLALSPTRPARERYHGVVYTNAHLHDRTCDHPAVDVLIVSALLGLAELDTPVPNYRIEFGARLNPVGLLSRFWGVAAAEYLNERLHDATVLNLLPNEHRGILAGLDPQTDVCDVTFLNRAGTRANTARIKVAKGQLVDAMRQHGPLSLAELAQINPLAPVWTLAVHDRTLTAVCQV